jgi:hypothetical protein
MEFGMTDNNLRIWEQLCKSDSKATQNKDHQGHTSINSYYVFELATKVFGPIGIGWGYDIIEDRRDQGAPQIFNNEIHHEQSHTIRIKLWYMDGEKKAEVEHYGHTKMLYWSKKYKNFQYDEEAPKKSLTDAIKKALSMTGAYADVFKGMMEDQNYLQERHVAESIESAADQQEKTDKVREDLKKIISDAEELFSAATSHTQIDAMFAKHRALMKPYADMNQFKTMAEKALSSLIEKKEKAKTELGAKK